MSELSDSLQSAFFQRALVEAVIVGAIAGLVGVHVLLRRLEFFVVAASHATFPGVAAAAALGFSFYVGGMVAGVLVSIAVVALGAARALDNASVIGVVLAAAFAIGVVILNVSESSQQNITGFLVGSILTVTTTDLVVALIVAFGIGLSLTMVHKELVISAFDSDGSTGLGYPRRMLDLVVLVAVTVVVVTAIPAVGTLLAVALLTVPAITARLWSDRVVPMMVTAGVLGALAGVVGLCASAVWNVAAGGAIALTAVGFFALSLAVRALLGVRRQDLLSSDEGVASGLVSSSGS